MNQGISILQGPHQVAQKFSRTTFASILGQLDGFASDVFQSEIGRELPVLFQACWSRLSTLEWGASGKMPRTREWHCPDRNFQEVCRLHIT